MTPPLNFNRRLLYLLFPIVFCYGCTEFIEPSLENKQVQLLAPDHGIETNIYQVTFLWEHTPDASSYRLQVVAPTFNRIERLLLDTVVRADKFTFTLDPGQYEWRVRAQNGSSESAYATRSLTIHPSSLITQTVQTVSPASAFFTNNANIAFEWLGLFGATSYRLQVDNHNFANENNLVINEVMSGTKFTAQMPSEGSYQYRVRAENATEVSKWSVTKYFGYDATPPSQTTLSTPGNRQVVASPVTLTWQAASDADKYELYVFKSDSTTLVNSSYPQTLTTTSHSFTAGSSQDKLVWRVRAVDRAGNKGQLSDFFSFTIQ